MLPLLAALLACGAVATVANAAGPGSAGSVVVPAGCTTTLRFQHMRRVEVVEPQVLSVVVTTFDHLSLFGKKPGTTALYVWDKQGVHEYGVCVVADTPAEAVISDLRRVLGSCLTYTAYGDQTVLVEGALPAPDAERARRILSRPAKDNVQIVDLTRGEGENTTGAVAVCTALSKILGDRLKYVAWNGDTVLVQGQLSDQTELERARRMLAAVSNRGVKVVDLIEVNPCTGVAPVQDIAKAVGDRYRVWQIQGRTVGVDGTVTCEDELASLNKVLDTFTDQARVVNLVRVVQPKPDVNAAAIALQRLCGNALTVRPLNESTLAIEGTVTSEGDLKRMADLALRYPLPFKVVNMARMALPDKRQICCHVRVLDVNRTNLERLGVNWGQLSYSGGNVTFVEQPWLVQTLSGVSGVGGNGIQNALAVGAEVDLLAEKLCAQVLSEPNLMVDEGGRATMLVGGEIPVPIAQGTGGGTAISIEWKQYGVQLEIEPQILADGQKIALRIAPEVSSLDYTNGIAAAGSVVPALRTRKASTTVTMDCGDTLLLSGLLQTEDAKLVRKIPLLGDLPLIGQFFRRNTDINDKTELMITVTPEIMCKAPTGLR